MTEHPPRSPFQASVESKLLIAAMRPMKMGDQFTYGQLGEICGIEVNGSTPALITARHRLQCDDDMVIACINGVGVVRLNDKEITELGGATLQFIRNKAKRAASKLRLVDFGLLDDQTKRRFSTVMSTTASVAFIASERQMSKVAEQMPPDRHELPVRETLSLFIKRPEASRS